MWLAWFLISVLKRLVPLCEERGEAERAAEYREWCERLSGAVEANAWDGAWYLRAFFDGDIRWLKHYGFRALDVPTLSGGVGA